MSNKKFLNLTIASILILATVSSVSAVKDVPTGHWAQGAVDEVVTEYGFMQGDPNGNFGGSRGLTRYEFAKTISKMMEYVNSELDSDRKDMENVVSVMELFQNELKVIEVKMTNVQNEVKAQNKAISEINDLALALGSEFAGFNATNDQGQTELESMKIKLAQLEVDTDKLQHKGLFIDTLLMGTVNDVKKLGSATGRAFSGARSNISNRKSLTTEDLIAPETLQETINPAFDQVQYEQVQGKMTQVMQEGQSQINEGQSLIQQGQQEIQQGQQQVQQQFFEPQALQKTDAEQYYDLEVLQEVVK